MKNNLTESQVDHIAHLARLEITDEERGMFSRELSGILEYVDTLQEIDTREVEATFHVAPLKNVFREDVEKPSFPVEDVLSNAPERIEDFFKMPKILDGE